LASLHEDGSKDDQAAVDVVGPQASCNHVGYK
jgi:hypothetical protein